MIEKLLCSLKINLICRFLPYLQHKRKTHEMHAGKVTSTRRHNTRIGTNNRHLLSKRIRQTFDPEIEMKDGLLVPSV